MSKPARTNLDKQAAALDLGGAAKRVKRRPVDLDMQAAALDFGRPAKRVKRRPVDLDMQAAARPAKRVKQRPVDLDMQAAALDFGRPAKRAKPRPVALDRQAAADDKAKNPKIGATESAFGLNAKSDKITRRYRALVEKLVEERGGAQTSGTKKAVAELLGVHPTYISRVLGWQKRVGWHLAEKACRRLEISTRYFVSPDPDPNPALFLQMRGAEPTSGVRLLDVQAAARECFAAISARAKDKSTESWLSREELATNVLDTWDALTLHQMRERIEDTSRDKDVTDDCNVFAVRLIRELEMVAAVEIADFLPVLVEAAKALEQIERGDLAENLQRFISTMQKRARRGTAA